MQQQEKKTSRRHRGGDRRVERVERVKAGTRRPKLQEYWSCLLKVDRTAIVRDRISGMSLTEVTKRH